MATKMNSEPIVSLENVSVEFKNGSGILSNYFGTSEIVHAVDDVSLEIGENEVLALVGESGCGKTTLGKTAIGLQQPTSGHVRYKGVDINNVAGDANAGSITTEEIRKSLQIIHQDPESSLNANQKIIDILSVPIKQVNPSLNRNDRDARIYSLLKEVGMSPPEDYAYRYPHQLSGGETQRIALIRALLMNPKLILADEAVSALDVSLRIGTMDIMLELQDIFNTSFLFISHNLANARYLTEKSNGRIGVMYLGQLVELGPPEQIINNPQHPYTKALRWATPDLYPEEGAPESFPTKSIDIPDPTDPPSGCSFHTRCPEARETCTRIEPELFTIDDGSDHIASCFRTREDHEYWESPPIDE